MATGFTSSATTVTTLNDLSKKTNTNVKTAIKLRTEEAEWFRDFPKDAIVVSANENRIPVILAPVLPVAAIPDGGNERIMHTPAPTHGSFLPVQYNVRHGFTGLAQAYDNRARAGMIENQLDYQANMSGYSIGFSVGLSTYGTSVGTIAQVKTTGSSNATQVVPLKNAFGTSTFVPGGDAGVQDTYLCTIVVVGAKVALIRAGAIVEFGTVTASPSASSGVGFVDVTFNSAITPTANDLLVYAMADGDSTITGTDYNNQAGGFTDFLTGASPMGISRTTFPKWGVPSAQTTTQRFTYATKARMKQEVWNATGQKLDRYIIGQGVIRDTVSGELGARRYDSSDVDLEGDLKPGTGEKYLSSQLAFPQTVIGWNRNAITKIELSDQPSDEASRSIFRLDKVQGKSQTAAWYDYFFQRLMTMPAMGYATNLQSA